MDRNRWVMLARFLWPIMQSQSCHFAALQMYSAILELSYASTDWWGGVYLPDTRWWLMPVKEYERP